MNYYLGIDNGGTVSKAAIFDHKGNEIAVSSRKVKITSPTEGWSERDGDDMWYDTASAIKEVLKIASISSEKIRAVSCAGYGNGLFLADKVGNLIRKGINSNDSRASSYIEEWKKRGIDKKVLPYTTQTIWAAQPNALLAWIRDNEPDIFAKSYSIFMAKDWIRYSLTGVRCAEITDMSGTSLMNVVDGCYDSKVLELFGIGEVLKLLPPLVHSTDICGYVTPKAASISGLKEGTPVAGGMFDIDACALSSGILDSKIMSLVAGTWGNNQYISKQPLIDKDLFMTSRYAIDGWYLMLEGSPTSAGNLEWFISLFLNKERNDMGNKFYDHLNNMVESIEPKDSSLIFLPFIYGSNAGDIKGGFYGLNSTTTIAEMARAVYEGVVFSHLYHIERLSKFRDYPEIIRLAGGASKSDVWCQIFADCIGVPIEIPTGTELGALGAAICAATAIEDYESIEEAVKNMTSIKKRYIVNPQRSAIYKSKYSQYKELITKLK